MSDIQKLNGNFIGLFDSGFGGISVLNYAIKLMPHENYIFYADSENCPYGKRTKENLVEIGQDIISKFNNLNPKTLIIACGTMSTSDPKALREPFKNLNIIGTYPNFEHLLTPNLVIEEHKITFNDRTGLESKKNKLKILILATTATCNSAYLKEKVNIYKNLIDIYVKPADTIVKAVENNEIDGISLKNDLKKILLPYKDVDYIVLGCTHFPFASNVIKKIVDAKVKLTSGCEIAANECYTYLKDNNLLNRVDDAKNNPSKKYTIKIIDAKLTKKRKDTFLRLLDFDKNKYTIEFDYTL